MTEIPSHEEQSVWRILKMRMQSMDCSKKKPVWHVYEKWKPVASVRNELVDRHWPTIIDSFTSSIENGDVYLNRTTASGFYPTSCKVLEVSIRCIDTKRYGDDTLETDINVCATLELSVTLDDGYIEETSTVEQWFRIQVMFFLEDDSSEVEYLRESIYTDKQRMKDRLDSYLIPYLTEQKCDTAGEKILRKYMPDVLEKPVPIDGYRLAKEMGLTVQEERLSSDNTILGMIFFYNGTVRVYDEKSESFYEKEIPADTILIDPAAISNTLGASVCGTILHECAHYEKHGDYLWLQHTAEDETNILCPADMTGEYPKELEPLWLIERQARNLAVCMQLPAKMVKRKTEEMLEEVENRGYTFDKRAYLFPDIIEKLADFFKVSKQCMRRRLIDLGYQEVQGVMNYANGTYSPVHIIRRGSCSRQQTFTLGLEQAATAYAQSEEFRKLIKKGSILYVENHFCLNDLKYVVPSHDGAMRMTRYGREHINECCLMFEESFIRKTHPVFHHGVFHHDAVTLEYTIDLANLSDEEMVKLAKEAEQMVNGVSFLLGDLPGSFSKTLNAHMERLGVGNEELAGRMGIAERRVTDFRNQLDGPNNIRTVVAICVALHLEPDLSYDLIEKSPASLTKSPDSKILEIIIQTMYKSSVTECNRFLVAGGRAPLTKEKATALKSEKKAVSRATA